MCEAAITSRSRCSLIFSSSLRATSCVNLAGTPRLSTVTRTAAGPPSPPIASALAHSRCATPAAGSRRLPYPLSRAGSSGVTSTAATPTRNPSASTTRARPRSPTTPTIQQAYRRMAHPPSVSSPSSRSPRAYQPRSTPGNAPAWFWNPAPRAVNLDQPINQQPGIPKQLPSDPQESRNPKSGIRNLESWNLESWNPIERTPHHDPPDRHLPGTLPSPPARHSRRANRHPQHHLHHGRRPGLRRPGLLRPEADQDAQHRPHGRRGDAVHPVSTPAARSAPRRAAP